MTALRLTNRTSAVPVLNLVSDPPGGVVFASNAPDGIVHTGTVTWQHWVAMGKPLELNVIYEGKPLKLTYQPGDHLNTTDNLGDVGKWQAASDEIAAGLRDWADGAERRRR